MHQSTKSLVVLAACIWPAWSSSCHADPMRLEPIAEVPGTVQAMLVRAKNANEVLLATQNPGADCGHGTAASIWKAVLDPTTHNVLRLEKKQDLSNIQNVRDTLFEAADGTLFAGGGWCGYKPPYFSTDGGETWQPADAGPVHPPNSTFSFVGFRGAIYAGTGYEPHNGEVYRWLGQGNWKRVLDIPPPRSIVNNLVVFQEHLFVGSVIYGWGGKGREASVPVYVSADGEQFKPTEGIPPGCTVSQLLVANDRLLAWADDQVFAWNEKRWEKLGVLAPGIAMNRHAVVVGRGTIVNHGKLPDDDAEGLYVSNNLGRGWKQVEVVQGITALHAHGDALFVAAQPKGKEASQVYRAIVDGGLATIETKPWGAATPSPGPDPEPTPASGPGSTARMRVQLADGSTVTGQLDQGELVIKTEYGTLRVPIDKLRRIERVDDGKP